jgi:MIP family channel proteins
VGMLIGEFIGTFTLIFIGAGSIIMDHVTNGAVGLTGIALAHGLAIACMASATGAVSGGHLNPAVSVGLLVAGKINGTRALKYIIAQCAGGVAGAAALNFVAPAASATATTLGTPMLGTDTSVAQGLVVEIILTFFLMFVIYGTAVDARAPRMAALFIGLTVTFDVFTGGPLTGAAMNPARSLGPALVSGHLADMWIYWLGPILGAILAAMVYKGTIEAKA